MMAAPHIQAAFDALVARLQEERFAWDRGVAAVVELSMATTDTAVSALKQALNITEPLPADIQKHHMLMAGVTEIGAVLGDLGRVIRQGIHEDNEGMRGNLAMGLERAACLMRGQHMSAKYPAGSYADGKLIADAGNAAEPVKAGD